jgi:hypothetical protein
MNDDALNVAVVATSGRVFIGFAVPMKAFGMTPDEARKVATLLHEKALEAEAQLEHAKGAPAHG